MTLRMRVYLFALSLCLFVSLLSGSVLAVSDAKNDENRSKLPSPLYQMLPYDHFNVELTDSNATYAFTYENGFTGGNLSDPEVILYMDTATFTAINASESPGKDMMLAFKNGDITPEGVGFFNSVRFFFVRWFFKLFSMFT